MKLLRFLIPLILSLASTAASANTFVWSGGRLLLGSWVKCSGETCFQFNGVTATGPGAAIFMPFMEKATSWAGNNFQNSDGVGYPSVISSASSAAWAYAPEHYAAFISGTGAVSATVAIETSNDGVTWTQQATITLSGTGPNLSGWTLGPCPSEWTVNPSACSNYFFYGASQFPDGPGGGIDPNLINDACIVQWGNFYSYAQGAGPGFVCDMSALGGARTTGLSWFVRGNVTAISGTNAALGLLMFP